jgi:hypothetical protein
MLIEHCHQISDLAVEGGRQAHQGDQIGQLDAAFDVAQMILSKTGSSRDKVLREIT